MRPVILAVAAAALLLSACSAIPSQPARRAHSPLVPTTERADQVNGASRSLSTVVEGPTYTLPSVQLSVSGFVPARGLLVSVWPGTNANLIATSPGRLLLTDPATGRSENLMGPAAPGQEPVMVTSNSNWVFWGQMNDQGGRQTYYLYNLKTGVRRPFTDKLTASGDLSGATLDGDSLYVAGTAQNGKCDVTEILQVHLVRGGATPLVVARDCNVESSPRVPELPRRTGSRLPLRLSGVTVARPALAGHDLLFVATPQTDPSVVPPSALVQLNLDEGGVEVVADSPALIAAVAADKYVTAFVAGQGLYAVVHKRLVLVESTQNPLPTVSGPLVTCGGGSGDVYDARSGTIYSPPAVGTWTTLAGSWVSWFDSAAQSYRVARLQPSLLQ